MPFKRSHRAVLASIGTLALAGCTTGDDATDDSPQGSSPTTASETEPSPTVTETPTTTSEQTTSSTPTPNPEPPSTIDAGWPMPGHGPGRSNFAPEVTGPTESVAELWEVTTDGGLSAPVVAEGLLFASSENGTVLSLDARTGEERWRQSVGGAAFTPRVMDGRVYVPTASSIVALAATDGREVWRADAPNRIDASRSDEGQRATLVVAVHGAYWLSGGDAPEVVALALEDGSERWRREIHDPWSGPLFASEERVFLSTGTHGRIPWRFDPGSGSVADEPQRGNDFPAERFVLDGTIYAVDHFFGIVHGDGWTAGRDAFATGPDYWLSGGESRVYYVPNVRGAPTTRLFALSQNDGETAWSADVGAGMASRPVVTAETVLVRSEDALACFDPADGTERWRRSIDGIGERIVVADDLLFTTDGDAVRAFRPP